MSHGFAGSACAENQGRFVVRPDVWSNRVVKSDDVSVEANCFYKLALTHEFDDIDRAYCLRVFVHFV